MGVKCFWLEPTNTVARSLRRYVSHGGDNCPVNGYHDASVRIEDCAAERNENGFISDGNLDAVIGDSRWPVACACGYQFQVADQHQLSQHLLYSRSDSGELVTIREAPPGAMWDAWWYADVVKGDDGMCVVVKLPNGREWVIDSQCSNCTMPEDHKQEKHHCWVRRGTVPNITVGKDGPTCSAGAGSIQAGDYHGFLINGEFQP